MIVDRQYPRAAHATRLKRLCPKFKFFALQRSFFVASICVGVLQALSQIPPTGETKRRTRRGRTEPWHEKLRLWSIHPSNWLRLDPGV